VDEAVLRDLKARHIAFVQARVVSPAAQAEWRANAEAAARALLDTRMGSLVQPEPLADAVDALSSEQAVRAALRPFVTAAAVIVESRMRSDDKKVAAYVSPRVRAGLDALMEQPGLMPERLWREALENEGAEAVMRDVLFEALTEFHEKVNPFFADWGLPGLLRRLSPFGLGGMSKVLESVRAEFDRRLEPEIRKFLQGFSRRALRSVAEHSIEKADEPEFIAIRKQLVGWVLEQKVGELCPPPGDVRVEAARAVALDWTEHLLSRADIRHERRDIIDDLCTLHARQTLREALGSYGIDPEPVLAAAGALATATWPAVAATLASPPVEAWLAQLVGEFYDAEIAGAGA
jgi:hypothetical protein